MITITKGQGKGESFTCSFGSIAKLEEDHKKMTIEDFAHKLMLHAGVTDGEIELDSINFVIMKRVKK